MGHTPSRTKSLITPLASMITKTRPRMIRRRSFRMLSFKVKMTKGDKDTELLNYWR